MATYPSWDPRNPANIGKIPVYQGMPGTYGSAKDIAGLLASGIPAGRYDNLTGNPWWDPGAEGGMRYNDDQGWLNLLREAIGMPTTPQPPAQPPPTSPPVVTDPFPTAPPPSTGGGPQIPGYGISQQIGGVGHGFGIPGFENNPMVSTGGSWAGTSWMPPGPSTLVQNPIPESDWSNPNSPNYIPPHQAGDITADGKTVPGFKINPAIPYQTTWNLQTYSGKPAPFLNIHEQMGQALQGIPTAAPTYGWASPQALAQLGGYGLPGGWTSMLGFTPGGSK